MTRETIESRMAQLKEELQRADEELSKLRPRVQYLETILQRTDGALTVLQGLLDEPGTAPAAPPVPMASGHNAMPQPVAP